MRRATPLAMVAGGSVGLAVLVALAARGARAGVEPRAVWNDARDTLRELEGFRRARDDELGPEARARALELLPLPLGSLEFFFADGRRYAGALERHSNAPKGVSLFVEV